MCVQMKAKYTLRVNFDTHYDFQKENYSIINLLSAINKRRIKLIFSIIRFLIDANYKASIVKHQFF